MELAKINNTIRTVTEDKNVKPTGIVLKGYASPEGSYASNKKLADNRVKALRDYIRQKNDFKADFFTMSSEPEDWVGFKEKVEAVARYWRLSIARMIRIARRLSYVPWVVAPLSVMC